MSRRSRLILVAAVLLLAGVGSWVYFMAKHGTISIIKVGGGWEIERRSFLPGTHRTEQSVLYHRDGTERALVDESLSATYRYIGDDCIVYMTRREMKERYFGACANRQPVFLGEYRFETRDGKGYMVDWELHPDGLQQVLGTDREPAEIVPIAEIKRLARVQPTVQRADQ